MDNNARPNLTSPKFVLLCLSAALCLVGTAATQGTTAKAIAQIEELGSDKRQNRLAAVKALKQMGSEAIPVLVAALGDTDPAIRRNAAYGLGSMGSEAVEALPALLSALKDPDPAVRMDVAVALKQIGPPSPEVVNVAVADWVNGLGDENPAVRQGATFGLGTLEAASAPAVPQLIAALKDPDEDVRIGAAIALRRIGEPAVPALREALNDGDVQVRTKAAFALGKIEATLIAPMTRALENSDRQVRRDVAKSLETLSSSRIARGNRPGTDTPKGSQPIRPNSGPSPSPGGSQPIRPNGFR